MEPRFKSIRGVGWFWVWFWGRRGEDNRRGGGFGTLRLTAWSLPSKEGAGGFWVSVGIDLPQHVH